MSTPTKESLAVFATRLGLAFALSFLASGFGQAAELTAHEKQLAAPAKKEGAVTMISASISDLTAHDLEKGFKERYGLGPDFKFNTIRKGTGPTVAQARQEILAGKHTIDVVLVAAPGFFEAAVEHGALLKLDSDYWKDSEELARKADQYFHDPYVVIPNASSFQPIWNNSCPGMSSFSASSYEDVVKPELKGKTIASDITKSFTYTNTALSLQENGVLDLGKFWRKLKATDPIVEFRTEPKMQMVISCQRPLDMWNLTGRAYQNIVKAPELAKIIKFGVYKEGQVMFGNQGAVLKGSPHPNAGKLLLEYMLSKEGTDVVIADEAVYSFRKNYKPPAKAAPYLFDLNTTKLLGLKDWVAAQKKFKTVRDEWQAVFQ
ncbi:MAG TPA: ABC transporter substrate-binding protein [Pseudolabrys sp.]|nr:ABC transporter substrate-binding protein [Pseudolabrys sp.]